MSFDGQTIEGFLEAREAASEFLIGNDIRRLPMSIEDALILQAASNLLMSSRRFYGMQVANLTQIYHTTVYRRLNTFEERDELLISSAEDVRRLYSPTEIGGEVLDLFQVHY